MEDKGWQLVRLRLDDAKVPLEKYYTCKEQAEEIQDDWSHGPAGY